MTTILLATLLTLAADDSVLGTRPTIAPLPAVKVARPKRFKLANGLDVQAVERHVAPIAVITIGIPAGAAAEPPGKAGLAAATADMLDEGAGSRSALELARDLESLGAQLSLTAGRDGSRVTLQTPVAGLARALEILADVLAAPKLDATEWKRVQGDRLTALAQRRDEAGAVASVVGGRVLYGDEHPYGHPPEGYTRTVEALTVEDLAAFHRTYWRPDGATLVATGDFATDELKTTLTTALARWQKPREPRAKAPPVPAAGAQPRPRFVLVDRPGAPQTVLRILGPGVPRRSPARAPLTLASTILGGSFTSRLNLNLREDKGYTYGAFGGFNYNREAGAFGVAADVHTKVTDASVREAEKELTGLLDKPLTSDELIKARAITLVNTAEALSTTAGTAGLFAEAAAMGEPPEAPERFLAALAKLSKDPKAVAAAVKKQLDVPGLTILVVGDRAAIEAPLRALGLPAPEVRDADGDLVK